jgi:hypothetical protein
MGLFEPNSTISYALQNPNSGAYIMLIEGAIQIGEQILNEKDAIGISDTAQIEIKMLQFAKILVIEVPMN